MYTQRLATSANSEIGGFHLHRTGPLAGRIVRTTLQEIQKASVGRKYARKDKRPLDPPPVVRLQCHQVIHPGTAHEQLQEYGMTDDHAIFGFVCHVDLLRVYDQEISAELSSGTTPETINDASPISSMYQLMNPSQPNIAPGHIDVFSMFPEPMLIAPRVIQRYTGPPVQLHTHDLRAMRHLDGVAPLPIAVDVQAPPSSENLLCTEFLAGETCVQCSFVNYNGRMTAVFVFSDVAVKREGKFRFRYRVCNIAGLGQHGLESAPILAECYGGPFEVFSTKTFPGLQPSTDLTKRISLGGIRVHARHKERKPRQRGRRNDRPNSADLTPAGSSSSTTLEGPSMEVHLGPYTEIGRLNIYPQPVGLFGENAEISRSALAAWAQRSGTVESHGETHGESPSTRCEEY